LAPLALTAEEPAARMQGLVGPAAVRRAQLTQAERTAALPMVEPVRAQEIRQARAAPQARLKVELRVAELVQVAQLPVQVAQLPVQVAQLPVQVVQLLVQVARLLVQVAQLQAQAVRRARPAAAARQGQAALLALTCATRTFGSTRSSSARAQMDLARINRPRPSTTT
jgi:hypothetical protein